MKYFDLDPEEEEILKAYESGKLKSVPNLAREKKRYQQIARNTLAKTKNVNLRITQKVWFKLKAKAATMGLPYQTLASSILHQAVARD